MAELLNSFAASRPDAYALVDETGATTWSSFDIRVNRLVHALSDLGVVRGTTIAAMAANTREYFEVLTAAAHGGFAVVPVNWHW